jgi:hypothetical protein
VERAAPHGCVFFRLLLAPEDRDRQVLQVLSVPNSAAIRWHLQLLQYRRPSIEEFLCCLSGVTKGMGMEGNFKRIPGNTPARWSVLFLAWSLCLSVISLLSTSKMGNSIFARHEGPAKTRIRGPCFTDSRTTRDVVGHISES